MKFTLTIFLGLGLSAAIASDEANLRANAHSRQLTNSQEASGGVWMYYLMLNAIAAPIDRLGYACGQSVCNRSSRRELWGSDGYSSSSTSSATSTWSDDTYSASSNSTSSSSSSSSSSVCPVRCHKAPHLKPPHPKPKRKSKKNKKKNNGGKKSGSGSNSTWADDGNGSNGWADDGNGGNGWSDDGNGWADDGYHRDSSGGGDDDKSSENGGGSWYNDDGNSEETENDDGNGGSGGDDNFVGSDDAESTQYLSNNSGNGNGNAQAQINSGKSMPVWPFLVAALTVGVVAAALMAKKRKQARRGNHALNGSINRRMQLFSGGVPRKEKPAAESSLYENDYENEPSFVEMRDPDDR